MPKFTYTAHTESNKTVSGSIDAANKEAAIRILVNQKLKPIIVKTEKKKFKFSLNAQIGEPKVKLKDKVIFTRQLSTMINAGVPLVRSLHTLTDQTESKGLKYYLPKITKEVESGVSLADSLEKYPKVFNTTYTSMVRAGEAGGILDDILDRLAFQQEKDAEIRGKLKSAMTYPGVILSITIIAFIYLMTSVVPKIGSIITDLAGDDYTPPVYTKVMLAISDAMVNYGPMLVLIIGIGGFFLFRWFRGSGRPVFDSLMLKIPVVRKIVLKVALARFARTFSSLSAAGVSVLDALHITGDAIGNNVIKKSLDHAAKAVKNGEPLSKPLIENKLFPPIVSQMVAVGEETGNIEEILTKLAGFYEEEVDEVTNSLTSIIEPIMIVILGGIIGVIALSVFGPISSITQSI